MPNLFDTENVMSAILRRVEYLETLSYDDEESDLAVENEISYLLTKWGELHEKLLTIA